MNRRVLVNVGVFLLLFLVLAVWAVRNVVSFDFIDRPYTVSANFATSPGLRSGFPVTYLGVGVGKIGSVTPSGDGVRVTLKIERGRELPKNLTATARRRTAVGEPYIDLAPAPGEDATGPTLEAGDVIPRERTFTPLNYKDLFVSLDQLVSAVPPDAVASLVHELAVALDGRSESIRNVLVGVGSLANTFTKNGALLEQTIADLTTLAHTVSDHRDALGTSIDNVAVITGALRESRDQIAALIESGPQFAQQLSALLDTTAGTMGCALDSFGAVGASLGAPGPTADLQRLLALGPTALAMFKDVVSIGPDGLPYLTGTVRLDAVSPPPPAYPQRLQLPAPPPLTECAGTGTPGANAGDSAVPVPGTGGAVGDVTPPVDPGAAGSPAQQNPASSEKSPGGAFDFVNLLKLAGAIAALAALVIAAVLIWRRWHTPPPAAAVPAVQKEGSELS